MKRKEGHVFVDLNPSGKITVENRGHRRAQGRGESVTLFACLPYSLDTYLKKIHLELK